MMNAEIEKFHVGRTLVRSVSIVCSRIVPFGLITILAQWPLLTANELMPGGLLSHLGGDGSVRIELSPVLYGGHTLAYWALQIFVYFLTLLVTTVVVRGTYQTILNEYAGILDCIKINITQYFQTIVVALLLTPCLVLVLSSPIGFLVAWSGVVGGLFIPPIHLLGAYLLVIFCAAVPVVVIEKTGVLGGFSRSIRLTSGQRWKVFATLVVGNFVIVCVTLIIWYIMAALFPEFGMVVYVISLLIIISIATIFSIVVMTVIYADLRLAQEGPEIDTIAAVFD